MSTELVSLWSYSIFMSLICHWRLTYSGLSKYSIVAGKLFWVSSHTSLEHKRMMTIIYPQGINAICCLLVHILMGAVCRLLSFPRNLLNASDTRRGMAKAFSMWSDVSPFSFREVPSDQEADIKIGTSNTFFVCLFCCSTEEFEVKK